MRPGGRFLVRRIQPSCEMILPINEGVCAMSEMTKTTEEDPEAARWNYRPQTPMENPAIFVWPINVAFLVRWFASNWLTLSERVMLVILAVA